jgi:hypothetical protein
MGRSRNRYAPEFRQNGGRRAASEPLAQAAFFSCCSIQSYAASRSANVGGFGSSTSSNPVTRNHIPASSETWTSGLKLGGQYCCIALVACLICVIRLHAKSCRASLYGNHRGEEASLQHLLMGRPATWRNGQKAVAGSLPQLRGGSCGRQGSAR